MYKTIRYAWIALLLASTLATALAMAGAPAGAAPRAKKSGGEHLRLLYWNIQNGMWDGQEDNYDRFVEWVKSKDPDVCVWCESASIFKTGTAEPMEAAEKYLPEHWGELASRYGHKYWFIGGWRDNYPQVITSRHPIREVARIVGEEPDSVVTHGAGWAQVDFGGETINLVTLHTWPQKYAFRVGKDEQEADAVTGGGDRYRRLEIEYVCKHTILSVPDGGSRYWLMMGDFNARSRVDNWVYQYPDDDTRLLVHDYIRECTPYLDVIAERYPDNFYSSTGGKSRIDFVYCTKPLYDCVTDAAIVTDSYTRPVRNAKNISNFWHPSDHRPVIVDFKISK